MKITNILPGYKTYISIVLMLLVSLQAMLPSLNVFSADVSAAIVTVLGALTAYFRSLA